MSEKYKITSSEGLYFVTLTVVGWIDLFTRKEYADIVIRNLNYCTQHKNLQIYAFCIMPSHIHMITDVSIGYLSDVLRDFKSYSAKEIYQAIKDNPQESRKDWLVYQLQYFAKYKASNKEFQLWQHRNHPLELVK